MTSSHSDGSANLMQELYFQLLGKLDLREALNQVPFHIQRRRSGFSPAQRCLTLLAAQAQRCQRLTGLPTGWAGAANPAWLAGDTGCRRHLRPAP